MLRYAYAEFGGGEVSPPDIGLLFAKLTNSGLRHAKMFL